MAQRVCLLLVGTGLLLAVLFPVQTQACPKKVVKVVRDPKVKAVEKHTCFSIEAMRVDKDEPGFTYTGLGNDLNMQTCVNYCKEHGFSYKMVALTVRECHCNKYFKDYGIRDTGKCDHLCPGSARERCGGVGYISAYPA